MRRPTRRRPADRRPWRLNWAFVLGIAATLVLWALIFALFGRR